MSSSTIQSSEPSQSHTKPSAIPKVDVSIESSSHLDPGAYVRGTHPIRIGHNVVVHPRVHLLSIHSPLIIGDGCIVSEKSILGGPAPSAGSSSSFSTANNNSNRVEPAKSPDGDLKGGDIKPTVIENFVHIHANVTVNHGATIKSGSIIEASTVIDSNAVVGQHSKISAGLTVTGSIPEWTVIWGNDGNLKRRQRRIQDAQITAGDDPSDLVEKERLKAMEKERDGTIAILKAAAARTLNAASARKR